MHTLYKMDLSKDMKENVLFLTDAFSKFSKAFCNTKSEGPYCNENLCVEWYMCMVFQHTFTATNATVLKMRS